MDSWSASMALSGPSEPGGRSSRGPGLAGGYRLLGTLGVGGMGVVYLAERLAGGARVALKLLRTEYLSNEMLCARLRREAQAVRRIQHPNVVRLLDAGEAGALGPYLAFEYLRGCTLDERLADTARLSVEQALDILDDVLAGLEAAHAEGVVHRDLKPANVFLVPAPERGVGGERAKVLDFGISRLLYDSAFGTAPKLTQTGVVIGTPVYMAPEQALSSREQDHRVDLYSAGVVLYELLSGALPHEGENDIQVLARVLQCEPLPLTAHDPSLDPALAALVHRAIARDPSQRFSSATEFRAALQAWRRASVSSYAAPPPASRPHAAPTRAPSRLLLVAAGAVVGLLAAVLVLTAPSGVAPPRAAVERVPAAPMLRLGTHVQPERLVRAVTAPEPGSRARHVRPARAGSRRASIASRRANRRAVPMFAAPSPGPSEGVRPLGILVSNPYRR